MYLLSNCKAMPWLSHVKTAYEYSPEKSNHFLKLRSKLLLIMKLTAILMLIAVLNVYAKGVSQKITLTEKNASLEKIFRQIKKQSGFVFWYEDKLLEKSTRISIALKDASLDRVLQSCFANQPFSYEVVGKTIVVKPKSATGTDNDMLNPYANLIKDITGTVRNKAGEPLANVSIQVKSSSGTIRGTVITNESGFYKVKVEPGDKIIFSNVGFLSKEITVATETEINIRLEEDIRNLNEVTVTALGIKKQDRAIGYSVTEVKGTEVQITREPTFINALAGKVAGLVVQSPPTGAGGSSRLILRGYSSLNGTNQPLYVVDGVPIVSSTREANSNDGGKVYGGSDPGDGLSTINPDDIETISILKGASAAALYGSYAQSGVIIITTKKGKKGEGLGISFNSNTVLEKMVPYDEEDLQYTYGRGNYDTLYTAASNVQNNNYTTALSFGPKFNGQQFLDVDGKIKPYVPQKAKDQFNRFFNTGLTTTNSLALTAASESGTYRLSLSQTSGKTPIPGSRLDKYNAALRATNDFGKKLHMDVKLDVSRMLRDNVPLLRGDDRGSFSKFFTRTANSTDVRLLNNQTASGVYTYLYTNPYVAINKIKNDETSDRIIGSLNVTYDITNHLHAQLQTGIDKTNITGLFAVFPNNKANNTGLLQVFNENRERDNVLGMLSYDNNFGKFSLRVNAGAQMDYSKATATRISGNTFVDSSLLSLTNVTINGAGISPSDIRSKTYSVFAAAQLGYSNYLFLELTSRSDWYSTLTFNKKNEFDNSLSYPSANLSYVFTDAMKIPHNILSYGKLRAAWGQTGGNLDPYKTNLTFTIRPPVNGIAGALITNNSLPPTSVKPEVTTEYEFGTELKFFNNRIGLDFAWYNKKTKDFLVNSNLSTSAGFTSVSLNAGSMQNKGVEILLTGSPIQTKDFYWDVSINAARNKNTILSLVPELQKTGISHYYLIQSRVGYAMGSIFGAAMRKGPDGQYVYKQVDSDNNGSLDAVVHEKGTIAYDASGKPILNANGQPDVNNNTFLGSANPDWTGGITNTFNYKNLSLSFLIDGQFGGYMYEDGARWGSFFGITKASALGRDGDYVPSGVVNTGTEAAPVYKANTLPFDPYQQYNADGSLKYGIDEMNVFKKTFIKFRQLSLGYSLPARLINKAGIKSATISIIGRNLFYLKKDMPIFDPQSSDSINNGFGYDSGGLPSSRTYGFNLNLRF